MFRLRTLLLAMAIAFVVPLVHASEIKTGGMPPVGLNSAPAAIITFDFSIESPSGSSPATSPCDLFQGTIETVSPQCFFQNDISVNGGGETLTMLTFDALGISSNSVTCGFLSGSPFTHCGVTSIPDGAAISFYGGTIPFGGDFTLDFTGFPKDYTFGGTATASPEPGTLGLMMIGLLAAALVARRRMLAAESRR